MDYTKAAGTPSDLSRHGNHTAASQHSSASPMPMPMPRGGGGDSSTSPPPPKRRRARVEGPNGNGCLNCRARKVKCPGKPEAGGACTSCRKFNFDCNFASGDNGPVKVVRVPPSIHRTEAGTPRARAPRACNECHAHKTRCTSERPQCKRCKTMNIACVYEKSKRKSASAASSSRSSRVVGPSQPSQPSQPSPLETSVEQQQQQQPLEVQQSIEGSNRVGSQSPSASSVAEPQRRGSLSLGHHLFVEDILARKNVVIRHFQMWFKVCSRFALMDFLHIQTTFLEIEENRLNQNLGKIVFAATARFVKPGRKSLPAFAEKCADDVSRYIALHMSTFLKDKGRENLLILVTTIFHYWVESEMGKVWMLMGLAGRMITALQLNWDGAGDSPFEHESIRRAVWKIWEYDRRLAGGFEEHLVLRDDMMNLALPVRDEYIPFHTTMSTAAPAAAPGLRQWPLSDPPLCVHHIQLHRIKHSILSVTNDLVISPTPHPRPRLELSISGILDSFNRMQKELFDFQQSLPDSVKVTDTNFRQWAASPECGNFVMVYSWFCELHIDLYRFSIPGLREEAAPEIASRLPQDFVKKSQCQAVGYAVSLSRFWRSMKELVEQRPADDGTERLLSSDMTLMISVIQCTKVLLAARKHRLYAHLPEGSSAALVGLEPVNDESLAALIQANMSLFDAVAKFYPSGIEVYTRDLRAAVQNVQADTPYDNPRETIGMPARMPPHNVRLPGPHYMLEQAIAPPVEGAEAPQGCAAATNFYPSQKKQTAGDDSLPPGVAPLHEECTGPPKPNLPVWLASARAQEADENQPKYAIHPFITGPFSEFQLHAETSVVPLHPPPASHQHQNQHPYGGQYQPSGMPEPPPRAPSFSDGQQQTGQQQLYNTISNNSRQQLLSNSTRSPSTQSSSSTPVNFSQPGLPAQPLYQYPYQHEVQPMQSNQSPNLSTYYQEQPSLVSPSTYAHPSPDRSALSSQHLVPPETHDSGNGHQPQASYWSSQAPTAPTPTFNPHSAVNHPASPVVYDRARGVTVAAVSPTMQLPVPHPTSIATQLATGTGFYVRAAGTLQEFSGSGALHP